MPQSPALWLLIAVIAPTLALGQATQPADAGGGDLPPFDEGLQRTLTEDKIPHRLLNNGDFLIPFRLDQESNQVLPVVVTSKTTRLGDEQYRSVFTTLMREEGPLPQDTAMRLLAQNTLLPYGSWCIQQTPTGRTLVLFKVQIKTDAEGQRIYDMARYAAAITYRARQAFDQIDGADDEVVGDAADGGDDKPDE